MCINWSPSSQREWIEIEFREELLKRWASPSSQREWIEIDDNDVAKMTEIVSPSSQREWIEMHSTVRILSTIYGSPSSQREWIEIQYPFALPVGTLVSLFTEGVD